MLSNPARAVHAPMPGTESSFDHRDRITDVFVVSEDAPGQWRVADRSNDCISGPFPDEDSALWAAFDGALVSQCWEVHVLDQFGILISSYHSDEDALHTKAS